jgi:hypothetical protein
MTRRAMGIVVNGGWRMWVVARKARWNPVFLMKDGAGKGLRPWRRPSGRLIRVVVTRHGDREAAMAIPFAERGGEERITDARLDALSSIGDDGTATDGWYARPTYASCLVA